jgi:molybdopterin-containing oxidoreductase family molybdopterin binding subunit
LKYPLKRIGERGEGRFQRVSWDEAADIVAGKFMEIKERYGGQAIAFVRPYGANMAFQGLSGSSYSRLASLIGATEPFLEGFLSDMDLGAILSGYPPTMNSDLADWDHSKLIIIWASGKDQTYWQEFQFIFDAMEKGAKLFVIDPIFPSAACKADEWIPIRPGTDGALALAMVNVLIKERLYDEDFVAKYTNLPFLVRNDNGHFLRENDAWPTGNPDSYLVWDSKTNSATIADADGVQPALLGSYEVNAIECKTAFQLLTELVTEQYTPESASEVTGIPAETITRIALEYATRRPASIAMGYRLWPYYYGHLASRAVHTLVALSGYIGVPGGGIKGPGGMGIAAPLNKGPDGYWTTPGGPTKFLDARLVYDCVEEGRPWPIRALYSSANFAVTWPNRKRVLGKVIPGLDFVVVADLFMTDSARYADIVLPVCTIFERTDFTSSFQHYEFVWADKAVERWYECKTDHEIVVEIAKKMGLGEYFAESPDKYIRLLLNSRDPMFEGVTVENLRKGPVRLNLPYPYVGAADRKFPTPSGKIEIYVEKMKQFGEELPLFREPLEGARSSIARKYPLTLINKKTRWVTHVSQFAGPIPWLRELDRGEPMLDINPIDARNRGIHDNDVVAVFNDRGRIKVKARLNEGIVPGVVNVPPGYWAKSYIEGSLNDLTTDIINPVHQAILVSNTSFFECAVEVQKI